MTYSAAFITNDSIILTADTVETSIKADSTLRETAKKTFFGEQTSFEGFELFDQALKIFKIDDRRLITAAGDKAGIKAAIEFLREHSAKHDFMLGLFESMEKSLLLESGAVQMLCAEKSGSSLILGAWASGRGLHFPANKAKPSNSAVLIGTAMNGFNFITKNVSEMVARYHVSKLPSVLALVNTYHQLVGVHMNTTGAKFGGAYVSAAITHNGIVWQPDVTHLIYSPSELHCPGEKLNALEAVNILIREELVYVERRTPNFQNIVMAPFLPLDQVQNTVRQLGDEMYKTAMELKTEYKAFISRERPYAVLLHHFHPEYCFRSAFETDQASASFSPDFYNLLRAKPKLSLDQGSANIQVVPRGLLSKEYVQPSFP